MIEAKAEWKKNYQIGIQVRQFELNADEPLKYNGEDTGMMPTELFISSLASCFCLALVYAANKKRIKINDMRVDVSSEANTKNLIYKKLIVKVKSSNSETELESLIGLAKKYCYVSNTISQSCSIEYEIDK